MPTTPKPLVILGSGGHARVLISLLRLQGRAIHALLDDDPAKLGTTLSDLTITGSLETLNTFSPDSVELVNAIGSAHRPTARQAIYETYSAMGYRFATLIHPAATIAPQAVIEQGAQIMAGAIVQANATVQHNCLINTSASIDHDTTVGAHTHIASGATICGGVTIGPGCHIGAGATVVQGVTLGQGVVVGAGATVIHNIPARQVVVGTPARAISP